MIEGSPEMEPTSMVYCLSCATMALAAWKGWPHKAVVPPLPVLVDGSCISCGATDGLASERIRWENVHEEYNTGLPDYWLLQIDQGVEQWGRPYYSESLCPKCRKRSIVSEMKYSSGSRELMHNCLTCGVRRLAGSRWR
jgi:hypothetical protein